MPQGGGGRDRPAGGGVGRGGDLPTGGGGGGEGEVDLRLQPTREWELSIPILLPILIHRYYEKTHCVPGTEL
ncbi:hypothetical protein L1987_39934 [Smallanthus sonchifolius]|uniref:Uncharacterized protein n=1 Tax=Smallanthus sonchifolius TaxID=185202 RepID=A0ACB9GSF1_9ASTR|nr:hypothetical protein L1987_39934 [Smallanthus sonchifolius]